MICRALQACSQRTLWVASLIGLLSAITPAAQAFVDMFGEVQQKKLGEVSVSLIKSVSVDNIKLFSTPDGLVDYLSPLHKLASGTTATASSNTENTGAASSQGLYFRYDPSLSPKVRERFIQIIADIGRQAGTLDADKENDLHLLLNEIDIMDLVGNALQAKGHPPHNVATATAYWLVSLLEVVHNQEFTDQQHTAVLRQLEQSLASPEAVQEYTKMSDAEKQALSERLMWEALMQSMIWKQARETGEGLETVSAISHGLLRNYLDIDANQVTVGDGGLMAK